MTAVKVTVLYEDQRGETRDFALHRLVMACVYDRTGGERHHVEALVEARPQKGDAKLRQACREDAALIAADGRHLVAVFDDDHVRDLLKRELPVGSAASEAVVVAAIKEGSTVTPERLSIVLLKKNAETVLEAAAQCDADLARDQLDAAIRRKERLYRDLIFKAVARGEKRSVRECILTRVPSLAALVELLVALVRNELTPSPEG